MANGIRRRTCDDRRRRAAHVLRRSYVPVALRGLRRWFRGAVRLPGTTPTSCTTSPGLRPSRAWLSGCTSGRADCARRVRRTCRLSRPSQPRSRKHPAVTGPVVSLGAHHRRTLAHELRIPSEFRSVAFVCRLFSPCLLYRSSRAVALELLGTVFDARENASKRVSNRGRRPVRVRAVAFVADPLPRVCEPDDSAAISTTITPSAARGRRSPGGAPPAG